jgi:predicted PurR-regulated permease PerM
VAFRSRHEPDDRAERAAQAERAVVSRRVADSVPPGMRIAGAWSWRILAVAGVVALVMFLVVQLRYVVIPLLVALLLAALLVPFARWLQRHGWPKWAAVAVSELGVIGVVTGLIWLIIWTTRRGYRDLVDLSVLRWDDFKAWLLQPPFELSEADINAAVENFLDSLRENTDALFDAGVDVAQLAGHLLAGVLLVLFTTLFILIDGRGIWSWTVRLFPVRARAAILGAGEAGWITLTQFVKVQIFVAFVDAVGIGLGAYILGLFYGGFPLVIPIAIAVFLGSFIPVVGAVVTGAFAAFVALIALGPVPALIMLGIVILVQQVEGHVLQPFIVGNVVKVHPVAVVIAVATGGYVAGIAGALFAVPLVAVANVMIGYIARGEWRTNPHPKLADVVPRSRGPRRSVQ